MKKNIERTFFNTILIILLFLPISVFTQDNRGIQLHSRRIALVIGNNAYQNAPLKNPVNDAEDIADTLGEFGFEVILKKNADQRDMEDAIRNFGKQLGTGGVGLFYFAGHGIQVEGRNYLIPINARIESESDVKYEAIDAGRVLGKMEDAENKLNIVIIDACRNNPFARAFRTSERGLARMDAPTGSLIAYATAPGEVAVDGPERNGIFTKYLLKHIGTQGLPIEQVLKRVRIDVVNETDGKQVPWESSSLMGEFVFDSIEIAGTIGTSDLSSPTDNQKKSYAAIPDTKKKIDRKDSRFKLAIFPMYVSRIAQGGSPTYAKPKEAALSCLGDVLGTHELFVLIYTYYDLKISGKTQKISKNIINPNAENDLWIKSNFFSSAKKPNIDIVCELGNKLKADFVTMYSFTFDESEAGWDIDLYLIDVKNQQTYLDTISVYYASINSYLKGFTKDFFSEYKDHLIE